METENITFPFDWQEILQEIESRKGIIFMLGATDSGKTTLAKYIISQKLKHIQEIVFIDSDIGQSTLGPPATISMVVVRKTSPPPDKLLPLSMRFIGSVSPSGHLLETVAAVKDLLEKALSWGIGEIIIDTTGMVCGEEGVALKINKIQLIKPNVIVAIQKEKELEDILRLLKFREGFHLYCLRPPPGINTRTTEERRNYRAKKFENYFQGAELKKIYLKNVEFYRFYPFRMKNLILGLLDENLETLSLAIGLRQNTDYLEVITPLIDVKRVRIIHGGSFGIDLNTWREIPVP